MTPPATAPVCPPLDSLATADCLALMKRSGVGRVAITIGALPVVVPICYCVTGGHILFFIGQRSKEISALSGTVIAFETNSQDAPIGEAFRWSVQVTGTARVVADHVRAAAAAAAGLRPFDSSNLTQLIDLEPGKISGWRIDTGGEIPPVVAVGRSLMATERPADRGVARTAGSRPHS
jgi:hypothetical protein